MKAAITGIALLTVLWLGWSFQAPVETSWEASGADSHRLGLVIESTAALPVAEVGGGEGNLFLLLTTEPETPLALR